jgi:hypothetical protein
MKRLSFHPAQLALLALAAVAGIASLFGFVDAPVAAGILLANMPLAITNETLELAKTALSKADDQIEQTTNPRSRIGFIRVKADDKCDGVIHAILIEAYHAEAYADYDAEIIDRSDVGADLIYLPNMPVSSWQMQRILCDTYNRLGYQSRLAICLPFFHSEPLP